MSDRRSINDLRLGDMAVVASVDACDAVGTRIMEMGVTPGVAVTLIGISPLGDPLELDVCGYRLSLRRAEAARVLIGSPTANRTCPST